MKTLVIIGARGLVSGLLQDRLAVSQYHVQVISTDAVLDREVAVPDCDLVVLATQDFKSAEVMELIPAHQRVLDISPMFRCDPNWVYGLTEPPGARDRIREADRVANPGCFATSAILLLNPVKHLLGDQPCVYLDGVGGYSTGGSSMIEKFESGFLNTEAVYGLKNEHRHIQEIKRNVGLDIPVWFKPKIAAVYSGIRMQIPLMGVDPQRVRDLYSLVYEGTEIQVIDEIPSRLACDHWANERGAGIYVIDQPDGCMAICTMDNLGKGALDSAVDNINLMLS